MEEETEITGLENLSVPERLLAWPLQGPAFDFINTQTNRK